MDKVLIMVRCRVRKPAYKGYYIEDISKGTLLGARPTLKSALAFAKGVNKKRKKYMMVTKAVKIVDCK